MAKEEQKQFSEDLNNFYCRFEINDFQKDLDDIIANV